LTGRRRPTDNLFARIREREAGRPTEEGPRRDGGELKMEIGEILPEELNERLSGGERLCILDVREPEEVAIARFPGATHIPMGEIPSRASELNRGQETVVVCHHGVRSAQVAMYLARLGFARVSNLSGGIDLWSATVDPTVPRY
jgi:rhodanese-related sulfurtransferase